MFKRKAIHAMIFIFIFLLILGCSNSKKEEPASKEMILNPTIVTVDIVDVETVSSVAKTQDVPALLKLAKDKKIFITQNPVKVLASTDKTFKGLYFITVLEGEHVNDTGFVFSSTLSNMK
ncbi:hypothetical protein [Pelosinus propionicus]|uniref:Uncharacterized protein n=1 Tax=Pelosinus propionicus DSM 13327 TaxID=1123291 RepID=A0A1I4N139_9FIRM|nr:hypothetical protein [Pelosinus propionicus]SFM09085.1 hypothetical protein SAMN04490355_104016 [Pelosinus propionicus DSM 13327]